MNDRPPCPPPSPSPTIGDLRAQGVTRFRVSCNEVNCHHGTDLTFDALGLSNDTLSLDRDPAPVDVSEVRIAEGQCHAAVAGTVIVL